MNKMVLNQFLSQKTIRKNIINPNKFSANVATATNALGDITGFTKVIGTETITSDDTQIFTGSKSLKVETPGGVANEGCYLDAPGVTVVNGGTYTCITYVKCPTNYSGRQIRLTGSGGLTGATYTLTGGWQELKIGGTMSGTTWVGHVKNPNNDGAMVFHIGKCILRPGSY